jgi:ElaB/YqjD/DUF883 family membrane-anchored ribosome-binding protein
MDLEEQVQRNTADIAQLKQSIAVLQQDQKNLRERINELKSDIQNDIRQVKSDLQDDIKTLRDDIMSQFRNVASSRPVWISVGIAALSVVVSIIGIIVHL